MALTCRDLADAVDLQTADEERDLLPLLDAYLDAAQWTAIAASSPCGLGRRERRFVLGLTLEDAGAGERPRLLDGLPRRTRLAWRLSGARRYRAAVVRLRGAPPAVWARGRLSSATSRRRSSSSRRSRQCWWSCRVPS